MILASTPKQLRLCGGQACVSGGGERTHNHAGAQTCGDDP
jgi:hypothetical protein